MERDTYQIKIAGFEGPFGLLLNLIEKRKMHINDVSLSAVTEDYLQYMGKLGGLPPLPTGRQAAEISSFVLVASTLLLIKSKSLLPNLDLTSEEEGDIKSLEERLRLYELFTRLGGNIKNNFGRKIIFPPNERKNEFLVFLPDEQITRESMMAYARNVLGSMPKKVYLPEVEVRKVISLEEMISNLTERITKAMKMSFSEFSGKRKDGAHTREEKVFVIVGFLAMLELVRNGILDAVQEINGGDIMIEKLELTETLENNE